MRRLATARRRIVPFGIWAPGEAATRLKRSAVSREYSRLGDSVVDGALAANLFRGLGKERDRRAGVSEDRVTGASTSESCRSCYEAH